MIITIDGPAGSGKSSVAAKLAEKLNIAYLDTGAMYRAVTLWAMEKRVPLDDETALARMTEKCRIEITCQDGENKIRLDGRDITGAIRTPEVTEQAHKPASLPAVRRCLVEQQRRIAEQAGSLVTEGRDQGTVVFPEARFKFYLDGSPECRAGRRQEQLRQKGVEMSLEEILASQQQRDQRDKTRTAGPLKPASGAVIVDTTAMTLEQVVEKLYQYICDGYKSVNET